MAEPETSGSPECVQCGKCLAVCPLFAATGREELSPRGKSATLALLETRPDALARLPAERLAGLCLGCGRCESACPRGVSVPERLATLKDAHPAWKRRAWQAWIAGAGSLWPLAAKLAPLAERVSPHARVLAGLAPARLPEPWLRIEPAQGDVPRPVALFPGCLASSARTDWRDKAERLLRGQGFTLTDVDFGCCGLTLGRAGLPKERAEARARNLAAWRASGRPALVVFCASCAKGLRETGRDLAPEDAAAWNVTPLSALLAAARIGAARDPGPVLHHRPCHAALISGDPDAALLARALESVNRTLLAPSLADGCCGFGGLTRLADPGLADAVTARNWTLRLAALPSPDEPAQLLTGCSACAAHLSASAPESVVAGHWLDAVV